MTRRGVPVEHLVLFRIKQQRVQKQSRLTLIPPNNSGYLEAVNWLVTLVRVGSACCIIKMNLISNYPG